MPGAVYRFHCFVVDTNTHALLRDGVRLSIQEQPFQVLLALLASPGQVVTREALRHRLWGTDTFVDFDQSLNSAVRRLRLALDDNSRSPIYLETLPRVGFRFLPHVTIEESPHHPLADAQNAAEIEPATSLPSFAESPALHGSFAKSSQKVAIAGTLAICLGFLLGLLPARWHLQRAAHPRPAEVLTAQASSDEAFTEVSAAPLRESGTPQTLAPDATMLELEGWYHLRQRTQADYLAAHQEFEHTLARRPGSASALVGLGQTEILLALNGDAPRERIRQAKVAGQKALAVSPHLAEAHTVIGAADALIDWNDVEASQEFKTALRLDPHDSLTHLWYAVFVLLPSQRYVGAEQEAAIAIREDPLSLIAHTDLGWILYSEGKRSAALDQYRFVLQLNPGFIPAQFRLRQVTAEEHPELPQAPGESRNTPVYQAALASQTVSGEPSSACAGLGQAHPSLDALRNAVQQRCPEAYFFGQDPELHQLRSDPGFLRLLKTAHPPDSSR